jgi:hypothetical protein
VARGDVERVSPEGEGIEVRLDQQAQLANQIHRHRGSHGVDGLPLTAKAHPEADPTYLLVHDPLVDVAVARLKELADSGADVHLLDLDAALAERPALHEHAPRVLLHGNHLPGDEVLAHPLLAELGDLASLSIDGVEPLDEKRLLGEGHDVVEGERDEVVAHEEDRGEVRVHGPSPRALPLREAHQGLALSGGEVPDQDDLLVARGGERHQVASIRREPRSARSRLGEEGLDRGRRGRFGWRALRQERGGEH